VSDLPELRLLGGDGPEDSGPRRYDPGATLPAVVRLEAGRARAYRAVYAQARWTAQGTGLSDTGEGPIVTVSGAAIEPGPSVELPFDYPLPAYPWTYSGQLIEITWELQIRLDAPFGSDPITSQVFVLAPTTRGGDVGAATAKGSPAG
jgi:hypothetical protein